MTTRVTAREVRDIIDVDESVSLTAFIATATSLTDWLESQDSDSMLSSDLLKQIEMYLAAHFYAHRDQLYSQKSTGKSSGSFQGQFGMRLDSTQYGQTAVVLDITGTLAGLSRGRHKATVTWLGKPQSEAIDYEDRD